MDNEYQGEEWRDIEGYEGLYQVSNFGRVKSFHRNTQRIMSDKERYPYKSVGLYKEGKTTSRLIHELVAYAFIGSRPDGFLIHHKDGGRFNNHVDNLEYVTASYNVRHTTEVLQADRAGMKLTRDQVWEMLKLGQQGITINAIAKQFGISETYAGNILIGKSWSHLPGRPFLRRKPFRPLKKR